MKSVAPPRAARTVRVFAPATVANFGVGFDLVGAALEGPGDVVTAKLSSRPGIRLVSVTGDGGRLPRDAGRNTAAVAARHVLERAVAEGLVPAETGIALSLAKGLPLASGLGSSAASAAAGARAAANLLGVTKLSTLLTAVLLAENAADGSWHGDNAFASLLGGLLLVPSSDPVRPRAPVAIPYPDRLRLVLVHPDLELPTAESRAVLPRTLTLGEHTGQSGALAGLVLALGRGDLKTAGRLVSSDRVAEPNRSRLVRGYAQVTAALRKAGAFGHALAGAGPSILALTEEGPRAEEVARAAERGWALAGVTATASVHRIDPSGARELPPTRRGRTVL